MRARNAAEETTEHTTVTHELPPTSYRTHNQHPLKRKNDVSEPHIPTFKPCLIDIDKFEKLLVDHPNKFLVNYIVDGLRNGFDIGFKGEFSATRPPNLKSANQNKDSIQQAIEKEIKRGHTAGPFPHPPFPNTHCSPIGAAPKKDGTVRLIMDLSQPHGSSINDDISKEQFSIEYSHFDDAVDLVNRKGRGSLMCKLDIKHAYRLLPVRPDQWHHLCYYWEGNYYVDMVLPFGLRSSGGIFNQFAKLIRWIVINKYNIKDIINYSDDFFTVCEKDYASALTQLQTIITAFNDMKIPLAEEKIEGPSTSITYLGIIINSYDMTIEIPNDKFTEAKYILKNWKIKHTCTKRQLKSLIGKLGFISKVVQPGRMFSRRLIDISTTVKRMHHHITLNQEAKADMQWWIDFLPHWKTKTMIPPTFQIQSTDIQLHTDASDIGWGATYNKEWIQGRWVLEKGKVPHSIDFRELFAITAAALTWGPSWHGQRVVFITDNKPITQVWQSGTSKSTPLMSLIRPLFLFAAKTGFRISFKHIFGEYNPAADALSRFQMERFRTLTPDADVSPTTLTPAVRTLCTQHSSTT